MNYRQGGIGEWFAGAQYVAALLFSKRKKKRTRAGGCDTGEKKVKGSAQGA